MKATYGIVTTTFPDEESAAKILDILIVRRLVACVQTTAIQSTYRWKGAVNREPEIMATMKTKRSLYPQVEAAIRAHHPYEMPEIVLLPIESGLAPYLKWIDEETIEDVESVSPE